MSSSEFDNSSNYSIIKEDNIATNLEIIEQNKSNNEKPLMELSQIIVPINENNDIKKEKNNFNNSSLNNELPKALEQSQPTFVTNLLYGNPVEALNPKFIGRSFGFLYDFKGDPKITIGPDCKLKIYELNIFFNKICLAYALFLLLL